MPNQHGKKTSEDLHKFFQRKGYTIKFESDIPENSSIVNPGNYVIATVSYSAGKPLHIQIYGGTDFPESTELWRALQNKGFGKVELVSDAPEKYREKQ